MLVLEVEFVVGRYAGTATQFDEETDYPPQPDRAFCALVQSWADRGRSAEERNALRWLECQKPPTIRASGHSQPFTAQLSYVPVTDEEVGLQSTAPHRTRQARAFPVASPHDSTMTYSWEWAEPEARILQSLQALANDVGRLGQARSLARFAFHRTSEDLESRPIQQTRRSMYPGYFDELEAAFQRDDLAPLGVSLPPTEAPRRAPPRSVFGCDWLIYSDAEGLRPDLRRTFIATRALRRAILSVFEGRDAPPFLSGHGRLTGSPTRMPHLAIFPLGNLGWIHADERIMGLAICLPSDITEEDREIFLRAMARLHQRSQLTLTGIVDLQVWLGTDCPWILARQPTPTQSSLRPERYQRASTRWSTVTPIVLDYELPKDTLEKQCQDIQGQIEHACERIGLPKPARVAIDSNSAVRGSPRVVASQMGFRSGINRKPRGEPQDRRHGESPSWERWSLPAHFAHRPLTHATLEWSEPVQGPIALGAGRFVGMGLCVAKE